MRETGIGTGLILIASGAILAFAIDYQLTGLDINTIGWILILVGIVSLLLSFLFLGAFTTNHGTARRDHVVDTTPYVDPTPTTPPHEHRRVETTDVVYEGTDDTHVERERRIRH